MGRHAAGRHVRVRWQVPGAPCGLRQWRHVACARLRRHARRRDPACGRLGRAGGDRRRTTARQAVRRRPDRGRGRRPRSDLSPRRRDPGRHRRERLHLHLAAGLLRRDRGRRACARPERGRDAERLRHRLQLGRRQPPGHPRCVADEAAAARPRGPGRRAGGAAGQARDPRRAARVRRRRRLHSRLPAQPSRRRHRAQGPRASASSC